MGNRLNSRPLKRRSRRTGMSPYQRHQKTEIRYSTDYYSWRARFKKSDKRVAAAA